MCLFSFLLCLDWNCSQDIQSSCHRIRKKICCQKRNNTEYTEEPVVWLPHYICCCKMGYLWCILKLSLSALLSLCPRGSYLGDDHLFVVDLNFFHNVGATASELDSCHLSSETLLIILSSHTVVAVYSSSMSATKGLQHLMTAGLKVLFWLDQ